MQISIISILAFGVSVLAVPAPVPTRALPIIALAPTASIAANTPIIPEVVLAVSSATVQIPTITNIVMPEIGSIVSSATELAPTASSALSGTTVLVTPIQSGNAVPPPPVLTTGDGAKLIQVEGSGSSAPPSLLMSTEYDIKDAIVFGSEK